MIRSKIYFLPTLKKNNKKGLKDQWNLKCLIFSWHNINIHDFPLSVWLYFDNCWSFLSFLTPSVRHLVYFHGLKTAWRLTAHDKIRHSTATSSQTSLFMWRNSQRKTLWNNLSQPIQNKRLHTPNIKKSTLLTRNLWSTVLPTSGSFFIADSPFIIPVYNTCWVNVPLYKKYIWLGVYTIQ